MMRVEHSPSLPLSPPLSPSLSPPLSKQRNGRNEFAANDAARALAGAGRVRLVRSTLPFTSSYTRSPEIARLHTDEAVSRCRRCVCVCVSVERGKKLQESLATSDDVCVRAGVMVSFVQEREDGRNMRARIQQTPPQCRGFHDGNGGGGSSVKGASLGALYEPQTDFISHAISCSPQYTQAHVGTL